MKDVHHELIGHVTEYLRVKVSSGFDTRDELVQSAVDVYSDDAAENVLRPVAERITDDLLAEHKQRQAEWPAVTDCDRLDRAFAELEAKGVVSRQNFSCCGTCGTAEIGDEIGETIANGKVARGYTFYHMQDTDAAASGRGLYLNYGSVTDSEDAALLVASEIVTTLNRHGLKTEWNGSWSQRIGVTLNWQRRR
jgi:hypothetical protein